MLIEILLAAVLILIIVLAVRQTVKNARRGGGCCPEHEETVQKTAAADRNKKHYPYLLELTIGGMTCENCARRVENALNSLDGIWASVSISSHKAKVRCKKLPDRALLAQKVAEAGYVVLEEKLC